MSVAVGLGTSSMLDPRLDDARALVRHGKIRAALDALAQLDGSAAGCSFERHDHAELVALTIECLLARGDTALAASWGEQISGLVIGRGAATALYARGELAAAQDLPDRSRELYLAAGEAEAAHAAGSPAPQHVPWRIGAALALVRCGDRRGAGDLAQTEHELCLSRGEAHDTARALRALATTVADGRSARRLEEARALLGADESRRLAAQIDTDLAGLLVLGGELPRATALLRNAERYAAREDLWPLQSRVRRLLERIGETPRRLEAEALAVLTNAERGVALLALDGLSNRQIAEQLVVSVKAVEGHLSKTYRKLGVSTRRGLAVTVGRVASS
ncbi:MAG: LuxR C-terminal-related transcriptional regulator [Nocardioides sp.]